MNTETVVILAGIATILLFGRDVFSAYRDRHKRLSLDEARAIREPIEVHTEILQATKEAVTVQSAVMVELRLSIKEGEKRNAELQAKLDVANSALEASTQEKQKLYTIIGRLQAGDSK